MEDVKHEQLLMVTFYRSAATELKKRLLKLIGNPAHFYWQKENTEREVRIVLPELYFEKILP